MTRGPKQHVDDLKVAIVCDWIDRVGGSERVIKQLHLTFPNAPIYTSTCDETAASTLLADADIRCSYMQRLPKKLRRRQLLTLPRQWYFGRLKLRGYDVVISVGSAEAKAVRAPDGIHINYCYTPTLYYWVKPENYLQKGSDGQNFFWRMGLRLLMPLAKRWDLRAASRPDHMIAISSAVQGRIKRFYNRDSTLIHPPADIERFANDGSKKRAGFVTFGRQVRHKRFDLAIEACNQTGKGLTLIGDGPEHDYLRSIAGPTIRFETNVGDTDMVRYVAAGEAFLFPNEEDFGIVGVEAHAAGLPVIAYRAGGALDIVLEGKTGEFFDQQTPESLAKVLHSFDYRRYKRADILKQAHAFSNERFRESIKMAVTARYT